MKSKNSLFIALSLLCPLTLSATHVIAEEATTSSSNNGVQITESTKESKEAGDKKNIPVQMLGVNDFHGALNTTGTAYLENDKFTNVGRASVLAAYLDQAQKEFETKTGSKHTERVQAGDLVGASPANSALLRDEPTMRVFNEMNFTIGTLGNHEFDKGLGEYVRILKGEKPTREAMGSISDDLWEAINGYPRKESTQKIAIANITNKVDGPQGKAGAQPYDLPPYIVETYGEGTEAVKVGYIGVVTKEFPNLVLAEHTKDFNVIDEGEAVAKYTKELREEHDINAVVVVSHVAATSKDDIVQGEVVEMMKTVDELDPKNGVDVVFAGHNHQYTNGLIKRDGKKDVRVVQSTSQGKAYIDLQGELDPVTKGFKETPKAEIVPTEGSKITPDGNIQEIVDEASEMIKPITNASIAKADLDKVSEIDGKKMITRGTNEHDESELGNLITDGQLYMANNSDLKDAKGNSVKADFAMTNSGGIRADLLLDGEGNITWGAAQTVQPFGNILQVVDMTGKDIKEALNQQYNNGKTGYTLQVSGLKYDYTGTAKTGDGTFKVENVRADIDGMLLSDETHYNVIINDFLFGGGDGFAAFTNGKLVTAMDTDTNTFVNYFEAKTAAKELIEAPKVDRKTKCVMSEDELEKATEVNEVKKGDTVITGVTAPNALVKFTKTDDTILGQAQADKEGKFEVKLSEKVSETTVNLEISLGLTRLEGTISVVLPEGPYIEYGKYVKVVKKNYSLWSNFDWKERNKSNNVLNEVFTARGKYDHDNGATYLSLYDNKGKWQGYINENATELVKEPQGAYIKDGRYVTINRTGYSTWSNFDWKERNTTDNLVGQTFQAKGHYKHANGATYLSLYDGKGKWHGYVNQNAVKFAEGAQGAYITDGSYVTISKDNYDVWSNFNWKKRNTSKKLMNQTFQAKGRYQHINGATYYSLYNNKGEWQGYINANAVNVGTGKQGAYINYGKKVTIAKKGYSTWANFGWKEMSTTDKMMGETFTARGQYNHYNGATYYSLFDAEGTWHGYVNKNAVK